MSDVESESLSSLESTSSVCDELDKLITQLQEIHQHHHNAIQTLENLHQLVHSQNNITITSNNIVKDLDEILEELHLAALNNIKETGKSNFGSQLLDSAIFK